jgi:hypothetical protein
MSRLPEGALRGLILLLIPSIIDLGALPPVISSVLGAYPEAMALDKIK